MDERFSSLLEVYRNVFLDKNIGMFIAFVLVCNALIYLFGINRKVVSRPAIANTIATFKVLGLNLLLYPLVGWATIQMREGYAALGIPALPPSLWEGLPVWLVIPICLLSKDFATYWCHRAMHTPWGFPIHAVHHTDSHVNGFTTLRIHWLEGLTMEIFLIAFLSWMSLPKDVIAGVFIFTAMHNAYVHFEVDIHHGPFEWLLASPRFHRWHHADYPPAYGKNLANLFPFFDKLFGTYYEAGACDKPMGALRDGLPDTDGAKLFLLPFTMWAGMIAKLFKGKLPAPSPLETPPGAA